MPQQHVILTTHVPEHLRLSILGCVYQSRRPDSLTVSCDVVRDDIARVVADTSRDFSAAITLVQRPHTGKARCSQVRNNAVRALLASPDPPQPDSRLIFIDGDTVPAHNAISLHEQLGGNQPISAFRINLSSEQTAAFDADAVRAGREPIQATPEQTIELGRRHSRYRRQALWRRLGLGKTHKPRLIGGHFSVPLSAYLAVNGCDELYEGYGQEDDDLARRLHRAGFKSVVAVREILVYHLFHPTRAPGDWHAAPGAQRFSQRTPNRAEHGVTNPAPQDSPVVHTFRPGALDRVAGALPGDSPALRTDLAGPTCADTLDRPSVDRPNLASRL